MRNNFEAKYIVQAQFKIEKDMEMEIVNDNDNGHAFLRKWSHNTICNGKERLNDFAAKWLILNFAAKWLILQQPSRFDIEPFSWGNDNVIIVYEFVCIKLTESRNERLRYSTNRVWHGRQVLY